MFFWDLAERTPQELLEGAGEWLQALTVARAEEEDSVLFRETLERVREKLERIRKQRARWHDLMMFVLEWSLRRRPKEEHEELIKLAIESQSTRAGKREVKKMVQTLGKTFEDELRETADKAKISGEIEGEVKARQTTLREQLEDRFGALPEDLVRRIETTTDIERLKSALRQVLHIQSLDELKL